ALSASYRCRCLVLLGKIPWQNKNHQFLPNHVSLRAVHAHSGFGQRSHGAVCGLGRHHLGLILSDCQIRFACQKTCRAHTAGDSWWRAWPISRRPCTDWCGRHHSHYRSIRLQYLGQLRANNVGCHYLVLAAFTKSAQFPFQSWLPDSMVAISPVSAYLHAAAMVKAGIYLLLLFSPVLAGNILWLTLLVSSGLITALMGAVAALRRYDLKELLAYSTMSQLGYLVALIGVGTPTALT